MIEKPYKCHICCKTYMYKKGLRNHIVEHADDEQFKYSASEKQYDSDRDVRGPKVVHPDVKLSQGLHCWKVRLERMSLKTMSHIPINQY